MSNTIQIKLYLGDESLLLRNWYKKYVIFELGIKDVELTGEDHSNDEIKSIFQDWLKNNQFLLKNKICDEWKYNLIKNKYENELDLVVGLSELLINYYSNTIEVSVMMFKYGLDKLCLEG